MEQHLNLLFLDVREESQEQIIPMRFWVAAAFLFVITLTPLDTILIQFNLLLDWIYNAPQVVELLKSVSGKFTSSTREQFLAILVQSIVAPTKKILFVASLAVLSWPIGTAARHAAWLWEKGVLLRACSTGAKVFAVLLLLILPVGLRSLGDGYGRLSLAPFSEHVGVYYRRLLAPAIAELFGFSGYLYYFLFSLAIVFCIVVLLSLWFERAGVRMRLIELISLCTLSFVVFGIEMPGYVDQFVVLLVLVLSILPLTSEGRLAILVLGLATHELSMLTFVPLIILFFTMREKQYAAYLLALYGTIFLVMNFPWFAEISQTHGAISPYEKAPLQFFLDSPGLLSVGFLVAHKLYWLFPILGVIAALKANDKRAAYAIIMTCMFPLMSLPFAIDTSRLVGFGFAGVLMSLRYLAQNRSFNFDKLRIVSIVNLVIPSFYVGLNVGIVFFPGLYKVVYGWLQR